MDDDASAGEAPADAERGWSFWIALAIIILAWGAGLYLFLARR